MSITARSILSSALVGENPYNTAERILGKLDAAGWEITRKPRIPEPGLLSVVEAGFEVGDGRRKFCRLEEDAEGWSGAGSWFRWSDLIDPVLVRDGVEGAS